jgi:hypothetical protein
MHTSKHTCSVLSLACVSQFDGENMHEHDLAHFHCPILRTIPDPASVSNRANNTHLMQPRGLGSSATLKVRIQRLKNMYCMGHIPYKLNRPGPLLLKENIAHDLKLTIISLKKSRPEQVPQTALPARADTQHRSFYTGAL